MSEDNEIGVIHSLARSGGTVFCKCIGVMNDVVLLSEVNPRGWTVHPLIQARDWFGLLTDDDMAKLESEPELEFMEVIGLIHRRCAENRKRLVIRDWSHLDFLAIPFLEAPTNRLSLIEALQQTYKIKQVFQVRHPMDQSLSILRLAIWKENGKPDLKLLFKGMRLFAEYAANTGFIRYEDFVENHQKELSNSCEILDIPFDRNYIHDWKHNKNITGNLNGSRGGTDQIKVLPRRVVSEFTRNEITSHSDYRTTCELLGYDP